MSPPLLSTLLILNMLIRNLPFLIFLYGLFSRSFLVPPVTPCFEGIFLTSAGKMTGSECFVQEYRIGIADRVELAPGRHLETSRILRGCRSGRRCIECASDVFDYFQAVYLAVLIFDRGAGFFARMRVRYVVESHSFVSLLRRLSSGEASDCDIRRSLTGTLRSCRDRSLYIGAVPSRYRGGNYGTTIQMPVLRRQKNPLEWLPENTEMVQTVEKVPGMQTAVLDKDTDGKTMRNKMNYFHDNCYG